MPNRPARFGPGAGVTVGAGLGVTVGAEVGDGVDGRLGAEVDVGKGDMGKGAGRGTPGEAGGGEGVEGDAAPPSSPPPQPSISTAAAAATVHSGWHEKQAMACAYTSLFNFCKELRVCHQTIQITAATNSSRAADTSMASSLFGAIPNIGWCSFMACDVTSSPLREPGHADFLAQERTHHACRACRDCCQPRVRQHPGIALRLRYYRANCVQVEEAPVL